MTNLQRLIISAITVCAGILSPAAGRCEETRESKWKFQWGPHVSFNIAGAEDWTRMHQHDPSEIGLGVTTGVYARYVYDRHWYVSSGLLVSYAHAPLQVKADVNVDPDSYYTCHFDQGKLSLPIHAGYRILFDDEGERALSFFTGTSLSCGFAGKLKSDRLPGETMYGSDGLWRRFDASWDIGATFEFSDFMVEPCGNFGCVNNVVAQYGACLQNATYDRSCIAVKDSVNRYDGFEELSGSFHGIKLIDHSGYAVLLSHLTSDDGEYVAIVNQDHLKNQKITLALPQNLKYKQVMLHYTDDPNSINLFDKDLSKQETFTLGPGGMILFLRTNK